MENTDPVAPVGIGVFFLLWSVIGASGYPWHTHGDATKLRLWELDETRHLSCSDCRLIHLEHDVLEHVREPNRPR